MPTPHSSPTTPPATPDELRRLATVLEMALDLEKPLRASYLDALAAQDPALVAQVRGLLRRRETGDGSTGELLGEGAGDAPPDDDRIGPYRLLEVLGSGGMGHVFLAERVDGEIERRVAIKVLGDGFHSPLTHQRFLSERQILAGLDHPCIARMHDAGTDEKGRAYLVMEVVDGLPIDRWCDRNPLSIHQRLRLFRKVCSAVEHAHQRLIVHRDLKPSNILVTEGPGGEPTPKLLDFGIAKLLDPETFPLPLQEATRTVHRALTPGWASPEQLRGEAITTATDVYCLGLLLYRMLTGTLPHDSKASVAEILSRSLGDAPPTRPSTRIGERFSEKSVDADDPTPDWRPADRRLWAKQLRGDLDNIVLKALRAEPRERYSGVAALSRDLGRFLDGAPVKATKGTWRYRTAKLVRRHKWPLLTAALALAALVSLASLRSYQASRIAVERDAAEQARIEAEAEARRAQVTRDFIAGLLAEANEDSRSGREVRLRSLVALGLERLQSEEIADAEARARLFEVMGDSLVSMGDFEAAAEVYRRALDDSDPEAGERPRLWYKRGSACQNSGDWACANISYEQAAEQAHETDRWHRLALLELSFTLTGMGRFEASLEHVRRAMEDFEPSARDPASIHLRSLALGTWLGVAGFSGHQEEQEHLSLLAWKLVPFGAPSSEARFRLVDVLCLNDSDPQRATRACRESLDRALELRHGDDPLTVLARLTLAKIQLVSGQVDGAFEQAEKALASIENGSPASLPIMDQFHRAYSHYIRARVHGARGAEELRQRELRRALELFRSMQGAAGILYPQNFHALTLLRLGEIEQARPIIEEMVRVGWRNAELIELAEELGALPDPMPARLELDLELPPSMATFLESLETQGTGGAAPEDHRQADRVRP